MTNESNNDIPKKKKRGRPKKPKPKLPEFKSDRDIREYILNTGLQLALELKEQALKKNNIKKAPISNAKNQQYKTALKSLETINTILKDKQLDNLEEKLQLMEEGIIASSVKGNSSAEEELPEESLEKLDKLQEIQEELEKIANE